MIADLDALMVRNDIEAVLVTGPGLHNPAMVYLTGGAHLTQADVIKKRGEEPVLFHLPMERDEAARTGLRTVSYTSYPMSRLVAAAQGDTIRAAALRYKQMLADCGVTQGRVALYGVSEIGGMLAIFSALHRAAPEIKLVGELDHSIMLEARATKSAQEAGRIRRTGEITTAVVGEVADYLSSRPVRGDRLLAPDGEPLRIRDVKRRINLWLAERGAENSQGMIFAIGRDAAVPHSSGVADDLLRLGQTIVFDIFPCEHGGGYYYDLTRTWCLGHAPEAAQALFDQVRTVYRQLVSEVSVGMSCSALTRRACELFQQLGHPTFLSHPHTEEGFVHPLGHGVGLSIHEKPVFGPDAKDVIAPGAVFTVEPGLYYPERGMGVRLEDTLWAAPDGTIEILAPYPMELVLPARS